VNSDPIIIFNICPKSIIMLKQRLRDGIRIIHEQAVPLGKIDDNNVKLQTTKSTDMSSGK